MMVRSTTLARPSPRCWQSHRVQHFATAAARRRSQVAASAAELPSANLLAHNQFDLASAHPSFSDSLTFQIYEAVEKAARPLLDGSADPQQFLNITTLPQSLPPIPGPEWPSFPVQEWPTAWLLQDVGAAADNLAGSAGVVIGKVLEIAAAVLGTVASPFAIFGDSWLLNLMFVACCGLMVYNLTVAAPKQ